jgi:hypothetical protein
MTILHQIFIEALYIFETSNHHLGATLKRFFLVITWCVWGRGNTHIRGNSQVLEELWTTLLAKKKKKCNSGVNVIGCTVIYLLWLICEHNTLHLHLENV